MADVFLSYAKEDQARAERLAAAGARVTVFDNSPQQLAQDRHVATREGLELITIQGDMRDLSAFDDEAFDLVWHAHALAFVVPEGMAHDAAPRVRARIVAAVRPLAGQRLLPKGFLDEETRIEIAHALGAGEDLAEARYLEGRHDILAVLTAVGLLVAGMWVVHGGLDGLVRDDARERPRRHRVATGRVQGFAQ